MLRSICTRSLLLLGAGVVSYGSASQDAQVRLTAPTESHEVDPAILAALKQHLDPVDAFVSLYPEAADELAESRLLHVYGEEKPRWLTEGDKLRLKRKGKKFIDITDHHEFYAQNVNALAGEARK